jgi:hypothetical protein
MPVTTKNTNYGDIRAAHRHHVTPAAPVAVRPPVDVPAKPEEQKLPTATKVAAATEQKAAAVIQAEADAAAKAKASAATAPIQGGPIPSPFDVLGKPAPETPAEVKANKAAAKEAAHGAAIDDDPEKDWVDDEFTKK